MAFAVTAGTGTTIAADVHGTAHNISAAEQVQFVALGTGTLGALALATSNNPQPVGQAMEWIQVTLSLDTSAYASGDLLAEAQEVAGVSIASGGRVELVSMVVVDEDDQGAAFDVYLTSASTTWGSENSAPTISDAAARSLQACVEVATGDYNDLGGVKVAFKNNLGFICETSGGTSLYVAVVNGAGTPTYTASGVRLNLGFKRCD